MDLDRIRRRYRWNALVYDAAVRRPTARLRARAVERLALRIGATALDFGCGTGLSFDLLGRAVGHAGRVIGVDASPHMLAEARERIAANGWTNVEVMEANAEDIRLAPDSVDGVLCFYTHDIMNSPSALDVALGALRPGGRFVAAGVKLARGIRGAILNPFTLAVSLLAITNTTGLNRPWSRLEERLGALQIEEHAWGTAYLGWGVKARSAGTADSRRC